MPTYLDSGFDQYMERDISPVPQGTMSDLDFDALVDTISASKIRSGTISSSNKRSSLNLDTGSYVVSDGLTNRVEFGKMDDGSYGLRIRDSDGNVLVDITGDNNILQSKDGHLQLDLTAEQLRVYDEVNLRILLGKGSF